MDISTTISGLEAQVKPDIQSKLKDSSKQYEAVFMNEMMNIMFKDIDMNPLGEGESSSAEDTYKGMMVKEYSKAISDGPGIGLADPIYKALLEAQIASQEKPK